MHTSKNINARKSTTPSLRPRICSAMILAAGLTTQVYGAAISYTTAGVPYLQNFDTLPTTISSGTQLLMGTPASPVELIGTVTDGTRNMAFSGTDGWFMSQTASNLVYTPLINLATAVPGTSGTPSLPSPLGSVFTFATAAAPADRSLGMAAGTNIERFGAILVNNTGTTLNKFTLSFTTEQYIDGATSTNTMTFNYAVGGTNINTGTFVPASALNMLSPLASTPGTTTYIDGNAGGNKTAVSSTVSGLTWANGTQLVIRWSDINESGVDDGLGIDDLSFTANVTVPYVWNSGTFSGAQAWDTVVGPPQQWLAPAAADFVNGETAEFSQNNGATVNITVAAGVTPAATVISSNTDTYTFGGAAIGGGTLTKSGTGTAVFTAANSFSSVSVSGGTLESQVNGALGAGAITLNGGTLKATTNDQTHANAWSLDPTNGGTIEVAAGRVLTLSAALATTGTNSTTQTLTKTGSGILALTSAFGGTYRSQNLNVQGGVLRLQHAGNALSNETIIAISAGAFLDESWDDGETMGGISGAGTFVGRNGFTAGGGITLNAASNFSGKITAGTNGIVNGSAVELAASDLTQVGADSRRVDFHVASGVTVSLTGATSDFAGRVFVDSGTLNFSNVVNRGVTGTSALGLGNIATTPVTAGSDISLGSGGNAANLNYTGTTANSTDRTININGTGALSIGVTDVGGKLTLTGVISSTSTPASLSKTGPGTLELTNANTYLGPTIVADGTLLANNTTGSATDGGNVTVGVAGTLGGTGTVTGSVTVDGMLAPGASIESLATGTVNLNTGSTLVYEASPVDANIADLLDITGNLNLSGTVALDVLGANLADPAWGLTTLSIASYTGTWNGGTFAGWLDDTAQAFGGNLWTINYNDIVAGINFTSEQTGAAGYVTLTQTVPEPSALLSLLGGTALLLARRRRS